jgi:N-acetylglucosamine kinase-like BadF-type ATPase
VAIFLGIDGGGSKTMCAVGDDASKLATATAEGCNVIRSGEEHARAALHSAIRQACAAAGIQTSQVQRTCLGVAGASRSGIADLIRRMVAEIVAGEIAVVGDMVVALEAAFPGAPGVVVIAGTGSIAFGRNERGVTARAGGWGYAISDEGSAHWIGREAVSAAMRAHDAGESTPLVSLVMNTWHLGTRDDVARTANTSPPPDFAGLFPGVLAASDSGDAMGRRILVRAGAELAALAHIVVRKLWPGESRVSVATVGGVFRNSAVVRQLFQNTLRAERPDVQISSRPVEPVEGALYLARRGAAAESTS